MRLFEPARIGKLSVPNRIVMAAMGLGDLVDADGTLSQKGIDYYVARARGGTGLLITSGARTTRQTERNIRRLRVETSTDIAWLKKLADAVHYHGAKVALQMSAGAGRVGRPDYSGQNDLVAPSALRSFWDAKLITRELTILEIEHLVAGFGFAAEITASAGVDAIELHGHEGYLFDQFMTGLWNRNTDLYGGDLDGRLRFCLEIIKAIKRGAGADFPIIYRFGLTHYLDGGRQVSEGLEIARKLESAGVDALDIDAGCYETWYWPHPPTTQPPGCMVDQAEMVKKALSIPVMAAGKLWDPELAESVLEEGKADFIVLGRPLLADPEWPTKVKEGRRSQILLVPAWEITSV